jgi:hypothetical protein
VPLSLTVYVAIFILALASYKSGNEKYISLIQYETQHWNQNVVTDLVGSSSLCSQGAVKEMVTGRFFGTNKYCETFNGPVVGKDCSPGNEVYGIPAKELVQLN